MRSVPGCSQVALVAALGLSACYRPQLERECEVSCAANGPCPGALQCGADQMCRLPGASDCVLRDAAVNDGADGRGLGGDGALCFGQHLFTTCLPSVPPPPLFGATLDTGSAECTPVVTASGDVCLIAGATITIDQPVRVLGNRPLVLLAVHTLTITSAGKLDASSPYLDPQNPAGCSMALGGLADVRGDGGGAGGSFGGAGGGGGRGGNGAGGAGGAPDMPVAPTSVRGGCAGGTGGDSNGTGAAGGNGGGAVYLLAGDSISIAGAINASGSPGKGGGADTNGGGGGGGGGAGGLIGLEAPLITLAGASVIWAIGGGGGGGAPDFGTAGAGAASAGPMMPGAGGLGPNSDEGGGLGLSGAGTNGSSPVTGGAGGGGGGGGWIKAWANMGGLTLAGAVDPAPTQ